MIPVGTNYWMFAETEENSSTTRELGFTLFGMSSKYKKRAQRMQPNDRVIFYIRQKMCWVASATVISKSYVDEELIWGDESTSREYKHRVKLKPDHILNREEFIDGLLIGPSLEYVKRWSPEYWPLAFWEKLHLLPQKDFRLLENEIIRKKTGKPGGTPSKPKHRRGARFGHKSKGQLTNTNTEQNTDNQESVLIKPDTNLKDPV
jgi:hypothetical protein